MKRLIYSNENIQITEQSVKKLLKQGCKRIGWSCVVKNGGVQLSSYERDYYCYFWLSDLVNYLKDNPEYFDEEYIVDVIDDIPSESVGVRSAWEGEPDITEFRIKYLGVEDPRIKQEKLQQDFERTNKHFAEMLANSIAEIAQNNGCIKEGFTIDDLYNALLDTVQYNVNKNSIIFNIGRYYKQRVVYNMLVPGGHYDNYLIEALKSSKIKKPLLQKLDFVSKYYFGPSDLIVFKLKEK